VLGNRVDILAKWFSAGFDVVLEAFKQPNFAYDIAVVGFGLGLLLILIAIGRTWLSQSLVRKRVRALEKAILSHRDNPRRGFVENWQAIDTAMLDRSASGLTSTSKRLRVAWEEFRETLVDLDKPEIRSTQRPQEFFSSSVRAPTWLDFCANLFVGAGLCLTFVGLVAALKEASTGLQETSDALATQAALTHLLLVASTKFITSIVGVFLSIILKIVDRLLERWVNGGINRLCGLIEEGLHHITPQGLATEQLVELRQQTAQLKSFATELAVAIGDRLNQSVSQAMTPVVTSITTLAEAVDRSREEQVKALREGVGKAISGAASGELKELSAVLAGISSTLGNMQTAVSSSGEAAARQISGAADQFAKVAVDMRSAFDDLTGRISSLGGPLGDSIRQSLQTAVADIQEATRVTAENISKGAEKSIADAASAASDAMSEAGSRITASLDQIVDKAERAGEAFGRVDASLTRHAESLNAISETTTSTSDKLREALQSVQLATTTTQQTTTALREVVTQFEKGATSARQSIDQTGALLTRLEGHQKLVNETWESYRRHFEEVDTQLGAALQKLGAHQNDMLQQITSHANGFDKNMATAVSRLRDAVEPLSDLAEELADRRRPLQAAE
jgi:predicted  nucleic acid-binding Zn-ribbon protein